MCRPVDIAFPSIGKLCNLMIAAFLPVGTIDHIACRLGIPLPGQFYMLLAVEDRLQLVQSAFAFFAAIL